MLNVYNDIEKILEITKDYLSSYDDIYFNLFTNIFKLIILYNTITYRNVISLLENINNINYNDLSEEEKEIVKKELYNKLCEKKLYNEAQELLKQIKVKKIGQ